MTLSRLLLLIYCIINFSTSSFCQSRCNLNGTVTDNSGNPLVNINITLPDVNLKLTTDKSGRFIFTDLSAGQYLLGCTALGYQTESKSITLSPGANEINIRMEQQHIEMKELVVKSDSKAEVLQKTVYLPTAIDIKAIQSKPTSMMDIVARAPGVRVREFGGFGSEASLMMGGVSGKGIPVFLDGIPLNLLGRGFSLANISGAVIEQIEIYKGIVPISLGADALGGAVNIKTRNDLKDYIDASYTYGSWNTSLIGISGKKSFGNSKNQYLSGSFYNNYADNNYEMYNVDVVIDELYNTAKGKANRFNDRYISYTGQLQYGLQRLSWADEIKISAAVSKIDKQWQHGLMALSPWGGVNSNNEEFNSSLSWEKRKQGKWKASFITGYNQMAVRFTDTASYNFFWDGTKTPKNSKGEGGFYSSGSIPTFKVNNTFYRINAEYKLDVNHKLAFVSLGSYENIKSKNEVLDDTKGSLFASPQHLVKLFSGISLESKLWNGDVINIASLKNYYNKSYVTTLKTDFTVQDYISNKQFITGFADVLKYKFTNHFATYLGYEYTVRLPDREEIFGDGFNIIPNGNLLAEKGHNFNLGFQWENDRKLFATLTGFHRKTADQIFLGVVSRSTAAFMNLMSTRTYGAEASVDVKPIENVWLYANATLQHPVLLKPDRFGKIEERYIYSRLPNIPFFFANAGVGYIFKNVLLKQSELHIEYHGNYIEEFFMSWEQDGISATKARVPKQFIHNANITYAFAKNRYSMGFECKNLGNTLAFDNYSVQKPGRSYYLKLRYFFN